MHMRFKFSLLGLLTVSTFGLAACSISEEGRNEIAMRISSPAWMVERPVSQSPFIMAFERMHEKAAPATIYIGGESEDKNNLSYKISFNPTPANPVGLHLASKDRALNLAYIGQPCQYADMLNYKTMKGGEDNCSNAEQSAGTFSPEIITTYHNILDGLKHRYHVTGFNLVGYSSGATLAAILAAQRQDVISLRTVAGKLDTALLEPETDALKNLPQHHFIGGQDAVVPPEQLHAYLQALGNTACAQYTLIQEATHNEGWVDKWPSLLKESAPLCTSFSDSGAISDFEPLETPPVIYTPRMESDYK